MAPYINNLKKGFTLLELLIVIAILAVLAAVAIFVLNPAETLREARDSQRISDLATLKTALALYITKTASPLLDNGTNATCRNGSAAWAAGDAIYYSYPSDGSGAVITDATLDGGSANTPTSTQVLTASSSFTNGTGWIKVNLDGLTGGTPISNMPVDPVNTIGDPAVVVNADKVYRYSCDSSDLTFEINTRLESATSTGLGGKMTKDGGNNSNLYEVGTKLSIMGSGDF